MWVSDFPASSGPPPLGAVEHILKGKLKGLVDRDHLCRWMKRAVAIEGGVVTDKYAFNILEIDDNGEHMVFWRSNEAMGAFKTYASEEWQATRQQKKAEYARGKGWGSAHSDAGGSYAQGGGDCAAEPDPWGRYQWPQENNPKGGKGWYRQD